MTGPARAIPWAALLVLACSGCTRLDSGQDRPGTRDGGGGGMDSATLDGGAMDGQPGDRGRVDAGGLDGGGVDAGPECLSSADCGENESCIDDRCVCELDECDGSCVDLSSDPDHCGDCSTSCVAWCEEGRCECAIDTDCSGGKTCCGLTIGECADLVTDPEHCGGCGDACPPGGWCQVGVCCVPEKCDDEIDNDCDGATDESDCTD